MKRVILTGATGFVGSNLAHRLIKTGHEVHLFLRPGHTSWRIQNIAAQCKIHILNLSDTDQVQSEVTSVRPDWIFHLAAYGAYSSQTGLRQMVETNLLGTANLLDACIHTGFEAFINTGSSSEYGFKDYAPTENEWLEPNSAYAVSKAAGTHYCRFKAQSLHLNITTLRLYSVYGPLEEPTRLIPTLIVEGLQGRLPQLVNPNVARDYVYVDDIVNAYLLAAEHPSATVGKIYNVGSGIQTTLKQVVETARHMMNVRSEPQWGTMDNRQWDTSVWIADHTQITQDLDWRPVISFVDGFQRTLNWFQSSPEILGFYITHREFPR